MIVLTSVALSPTAWAATCSNASLSGTYGFLHSGIDARGASAAAVTKITFDPTRGTFTGENTANTAGVLNTSSLTGTYAVAKNCTVTSLSTLVSGINVETVNNSFVVTSTGFWYLFQKPGGTASGFGVKQGSPTCTDAGVEGSFGFRTTGDFLAGAPAVGPVAFIGELKFTVDSSGEGVVSGHIAGSEDGTILTFADEPVTGSYKIDKDCKGTATIAPKGQPEMHFIFVVVDDGKQMLAVETDADAVVSGTLVKTD